MPFMSPNQQCRRTEGRKVSYNEILIIFIVSTMLFRVDFFQLVKLLV